MCWNNFMVKKNGSNINKQQTTGRNNNNKAVEILFTIDNALPTTNLAPTSNRKIVFPTLLHLVYRFCQAALINLFTESPWLRWCWVRNLAEIATEIAPQFCEGLLDTPSSLHCGESRWPNSQVPWRFVRGHDQPIQGSGARHLPIQAAVSNTFR